MTVSPNTVYRKKRVIHKKGFQQLFGSVDKRPFSDIGPRVYINKYALQNTVETHECEYSDMRQRFRVVAVMGRDSKRVHVVRP